MNNEYIQTKYFEIKTTSLDENSKYTITKCLNEWEKYINNVPHKSKMVIHIHFSDEINNICQIDEYYNENTNNIKKYKSNFEEIVNSKIGSLSLKTGTIHVNKIYWKKWIDTIEVKTNHNIAYYILLHYIGLLLGMGPLWVSCGTKKIVKGMYVYTGKNAIEAYQKLNNNNKLKYIPLYKNKNRFIIEDNVTYPHVENDIICSWDNQTITDFHVTNITIGMLKDLKYII
jgi:hypothetical protein